MSTGREIRSYDYVNRPYERVRDAARQKALTVFQSATKAAASRAQSIASELHVDFGGIGVKIDINISVRNIDGKGRLTRLRSGLYRGQACQSEHRAASIALSNSSIRIRSGANSRVKRFLTAIFPDKLRLVCMAASAAASRTLGAALC
jgi:hypothetical protein